MSRSAGANAVWRGERLAALEDRARRRAGLLMNLEEEPMLDPFAAFGEPPEPDAMQSLVDIAAISSTVGSVNEQFAQNALSDALSAPVGVSVENVAVTVVSFPVVVAGATGVDLSALEEPARRVAEIIEALQPVLVPPPTVRELEALVARANALTVSDAATYSMGCELYELLAANEKGIELSIGPVVGFFHRPWKALCEFRAKFLPPVLTAKRRLSDVCGAWKQAEDRRAELERRAAEDAAAADERRKLEAVAAVAKENGQLEVAETATQMAAEVQKPALPLRSEVPATATKGRKAWKASIEDEDKFYRGLADGTIPRVAAPIDMGYLDRQATDLKQEFRKRFPGATAAEKNGLTASGRRS